MTNPTTKEAVEPCPVCKFHWNLTVMPGELHNPNCPHFDDREKGCACQGCGNRYKVDIQVSNDLWNRIKPESAASGAGLLCGRCIFSRIEALEEFDALSLSRVAPIAPVVDDGDDSEAESFSITLPQLETRFQTATSHDEIVTLVWACRALLDEDAECAPFFTPEAQDRQMVHAATLRLYFEHAERVLGRQPYPAEVDEIETGFCTPRGQKDVIAKLERGRRLLAAIQAQSPASTVAPQQSGLRDDGFIEHDLGDKVIITRAAPASPAALRDEAVVSSLSNAPEVDPNRRCWASTTNEVCVSPRDCDDRGCQRYADEDYRSKHNQPTSKDVRAELIAAHSAMPRRHCAVHDREEFKYESLEHELRAATTPPSTLARKAAVDEIVKGWFWHLPERDQERARVNIEQIIERCFSAESECEK